MQKQEAIFYPLLQVPVYRQRRQGNNGILHLMVTENIKQNLSFQDEEKNTKRLGTHAHSSTKTEVEHNILDLTGL